MILARFLLPVCAAAALALPLPVLADPPPPPPWIGPFPTSSLPPPGVYVSPQDWHVYYENGVYLDDLWHYGFTESYPPPTPGGTTTEGFNSTLDLIVYIPGSPDPIPAHIPNVPVVVRVDWGSETGGVTWYNTEMLSLNVTWDSPMGTVLIRESPTMPSLGQTGIDPEAGGYMIQSFFDVFTELSVDGGISWVPSTNPTGDRVHLYPEPATLALLVLGGLVWLRRR